MRENASILSPPHLKAMLLPLPCSVLEVLHLFICEFWFLGPFIFAVCILGAYHCSSLSQDAPQERWGSTAGGGGAAAGHCPFPKWGWGERTHGGLHNWFSFIYLFIFTLYFYSLFTEKNEHIALCVLQRQKNSYAVYPKADPTPVTSSAPPVSTLYTSPVVRVLSSKI